jgi:prepilin-type N-terminal cleavage/methylation domain-containing protein
MRRPGDPLSGGFTFIELLSVITLISLAMLFAFLNLDGMTASSRLAASGRGIGNTISWIRGEAASQARELQIEFDLDNNRYRVIVPPRPGIRSTGEEELEVFEWELLPDGVRLLDVQFTPADFQGRGNDDIQRSGTRIVTFSRSGSTPSFMVHLESNEILDQNSNQFSVEVNGFTGAVDYEVGYKELGSVREDHEMR